MNDVNVKVAKWLPGPWVYKPGALNVAGEDGVGSITTDEAEPWFIAKIEVAPRADANARLISAAPEMYEALKGLHKIVEEIHARWDADMKPGKLLIALMDPSLKYRADVTAIHAAIAKAEAR